MWCLFNKQLFNSENWSLYHSVICFWIISFVVTLHLYWYILMQWWWLSDTTRISLGKSASPRGLLSPSDTITRPASSGGYRSTQCFSPQSATKTDPSLSVQRPQGQVSTGPKLEQTPRIRRLSHPGPKIFTQGSCPISLPRSDTATRPECKHAVTR